MILLLYFVCVGVSFESAATAVTQGLTQGHSHKMTVIEDRTIPHALLARLVRRTVGGTELAMVEIPEVLTSTGYSGLTISFVKATIPADTVTFAAPRGVGYKELKKIADSLYKRVQNRVDERIQQNRKVMSA